MNQRLQQFLSAENISQAQFADSIDVARASVSHVLAGRNKPGYDFIRSISEHYPQLNLEWLISGKGKMYKQESPSIASAAVSPTPPPPPEPAFSGELFGPESENENSQTPDAKELTNSAPVSSNASHSPFRRSIERIIVFYDDNTYQELK